MHGASAPSFSSGLPGDEDLGDAPDEGVDCAKHASASAPSSGSSGAARPKMAACACSSSVRAKVRARARAKVRVRVRARVLESGVELELQVPSRRL